MSAAPPGVEGAMMRIGRVGQSAALAGPITLPAKANTSAAARRLQGVLMRMHDADFATRPQATASMAEAAPLRGPPISA
jgi:hypothetical protein